jgi:hypothetical protein
MLAIRAEIRALGGGEGAGWPQSANVGSPPIAGGNRLGYYMRYIVSDDRAASLLDVRKAFAEAGAGYEIDGEEAECTIAFEGKPIAALTLNVPGDGLFDEERDVEGLAAARAIPGYRDHALKGEWNGYRAIRLSAAYRAIYQERRAGPICLVYVEEVNKHDY